MKRNPLSDIKSFSLLAPDENGGTFRLGSNTANDLSLNFLAESISGNSSEQSVLKSILLEMPVSEKVISYRRAVYSELKDNEELCEELYNIFDAMRFYSNDRPAQIGGSSTIMEFLVRLRALEGYVNSVLKIKEVIGGHEFKSEGLKLFAGYISEICDNSGFEELEKDLSVVGDDINNIKSITIGVNLDHEFYPKESGILSLNKFYFDRQSAIRRFVKFHLKDQINDKDLMQFSMETHDNDLRLLRQKYNGLPSPTNRATDTPLMNNLNTIIERMLPSCTSKLKRVLDRYVDVSGKALAKLADELLFYLRFIGLEKKLKEHGMPCCCGEASEDDTVLRDFYNVKLAICRLKGTIDEEIVCNDMEFTKDKTVQILTGPNRGGKTVLTQGIGLVFLLYQSGVFVPAASAKIRPCDGIYTHFPVEEEKTVSLGRLGEEAERFNEICRTADSGSLLLFNESFATTSHTESLYIAEDVLKYLCCIGARTCFNTHMHELAENADKISDAAASGYRAVSVVMENENGKRSYKIGYKKPDGKSYAHEIAYKYGITFEQLSEKNRIV
ncbi:MAG: hypothetical protein IKW96_11165 [Ruminococcus sp.]|uniref:MutS-related protein n=1 Tax=Ruminococcus sp. TaxID=41978 RepID=UPI0025CDE4C6|nr:hypothetical protein [Ruminococcus sp.]MBR5683810.1 hypothetical protein [Ruminococcus sp.]